MATYNTLYDYYTAQKQPLPSISDRAKLYEQAGLGSATSYTGTAAQNTSLLKTLQTPTNQPTSQLLGNVTYNPYTGKEMTTGETFTDKLTGTTYTQGQEFYAPTNVSDIQTLGETEIPEVNYPSGTISGSAGAISGLDSYYTNMINQLNQQRQEATKQQQTLMQSIFNSKQQSQAEMRQDLSEEFGIQAKIKEIQTLQDQYTKTQQAKETQIAQTRDTLGSMNFINNQIAQIERNSAPELNRLSADINSRSAILTQSMDLVNQAVQDAVADQKWQFQMLTEFYSMNQDVIDRLDSQYKDAVNYAIDEARYKYEQALDEKNRIGEMMIDPNLRNSGITTNDTLEEAYAKAARVAGPNYVASQNIIHGGSETTTSSSPTGLLQRAIDSGLSPEEAALDIAGFYENTGVQVTEKMINSWTDQARKLTKTVAPVAPTPIQAPATSYQTGQNVGTGIKPYFEAMEPQNLWGGVKTTFGREGIGGFFSGLFGL